MTSQFEKDGVNPENGILRSAKLAAAGALTALFGILAYNFISDVSHEVAELRSAKTESARPVAPLPAPGL